MSGNQEGVIPWWARLVLIGLVLFMVAVAVLVGVTSAMHNVGETYDSLPHGMVTTIVWAVRAMLVIGLACLAGGSFIGFAKVGKIDRD